MANILIIPDVHLKPWIYDMADSVLNNDGNIDGIVSLGDIPDDFGMKNNSEVYNKTFDRTEKWLSDHPETLWCIGNHEASYLWNQWQSGMAYRAKDTAYHRIKELYQKIPEGKLNFVFRIDDVIFSHAGISQRFVDDYCSDVKDDPDKVIEKINGMRSRELWTMESPLWFRPQTAYGHGISFPAYKPDEFLYVAGHTPMKAVALKDSVLSCDVCSTHADGTPLGNNHLVVIDTETRRYKEYECAYKVHTRENNPYFDKEKDS